MPSKEKVYVNLVSAEGQEFFLEKSIAMASSTTICKMLEGEFREAQDGIIRFPVRIILLVSSFSLSPQICLTFFFHYVPCLSSSPFLDLGY